MPPNGVAYSIPPHSPTAPNANGLFESLLTATKARETDSSSASDQQQQHQLDAEQNGGRETRQHMFICRHTCCRFRQGGAVLRWSKVCEVTYVDGAYTFQYNKVQQKHEEAASHHPCMCRGTQGLCADIVAAYIHGSRKGEVRKRFEKKLEDGKRGHQQLHREQIRAENGTLKPNAKKKLIKKFGVQALQDDDLDVSEREQKRHIERYMAAYGVDWRQALLALPTTSVPPSLPVNGSAAPPADTDDDSPPHDHTLPLDDGGGRPPDNNGYTSPIPSAPLTVAPLTPSAAYLTDDRKTNYLITQLMQLPPYPKTAKERLHALRSFTPLVFVRHVYARLASTWSGSAIFTPLPSERADKCEPALRLANIHLYVTAQPTHEMPLTVIGDDEPMPARTAPFDYQDALRQQRGRPAGHTEDEFYEKAWRAFQRIESADVETYAKDVELQVTTIEATATEEEFKESARVGLWGALWGRPVPDNWSSDDVSAMYGQTTARVSPDERAMYLYSRMCGVQKLHPLNPHLFSAHPRSLLHILWRRIESEYADVDWVKVMGEQDSNNKKKKQQQKQRKKTNEPEERKEVVEEENSAVVNKKDLHYVVQHANFSGFSAPMVYTKHGNNFFRGHLEQLAASSFNRCDTGGQHWIVVPFRQQPKMLLLFDKLLRDMPLDPPLGKEPLTADEQALLPTMLLSRQLFIPPKLLTEYGIKYQRHYQGEGDVMLVCGYSYHQGVVARRPRAAHAEAINYLDFQWLDRHHGGLRVVYEMCRWLRTQYARLYLNDGGQVRRSVHKLMFGTWIDGIRHFLPKDWSLDFFTALQEDIVRWCNYNGDKSPKPYLNYDTAGSPLNTDDGKVAARRLQYCIETLELPEVKVLYLDGAKQEAERVRLMQKAKEGRPSDLPPQQEDDVWHISIFNPPPSTPPPTVTTLPANNHMTCGQEDSDHQAMSDSPPIAAATAVEALHGRPKRKRSNGGATESSTESSESKSVRRKSERTKAR